MMRPLSEMPLPMLPGEERQTIDGVVRERGELGDSKLTIEVELMPYRILQQHSRQLSEAQRVLRSLIS